MKFEMKTFRRIFTSIICVFLILFVFVFNPKLIRADSGLIEDKNEYEFKRSLESLRDFDYRTWQVVVYPRPEISNKLVLRIVGYPGELRIDHPTNLIVSSGRKNWELNDVTKNNKILLKNSMDDVGEFDITPLVNELDKNRPLRLFLPGVINDLPIPPYLVSEWRELNKFYKNDQS